MMLRLLITLCSTALCAGAPAARPDPLVLEMKIPLSGVSGRMDHLAVDVGQKRLFVAALGNNTVEVVDFAAGKRTRSLAGFDEPQGLAYSSRSQILYVANGGDGSLRMLHGRELKPAGRIALGEDADNIRIDDEQRRVYVGYGQGALAVIDEATHKRTADIRLQAHPESFQLEKAGSRIFVNVPDAGEIAVVDRRTNEQVATWPTKDLRAAFPLALDEPHERLLAVFRRPPTLALFELENGAVMGQVASCADADEIFVDDGRGYVYVICGDGFVDAWANRRDGLEHAARVKTSSGARTGLFSPELRRLFVAARAAAGNDAQIWVFRASE